MIRLVHPFEVDAIWQHLQDGMERALRKPDSNRSVLELYQACRVGAWFLHVVEEDGKIIAGIITEPAEHPRGRYLRIRALCGWEMERWLPEMLKHDWLKMLGFKFALFEGRRGFERKIPGVKVVRQVYELELST